jgi:tetratricopeptide (TPR) repeat protein
MRFFVILFLFFNFVYGDVDVDFEKHLDSTEKAETYLENLVFDGEFDKAESFFIIAQKKFPESENLLCWAGKLYVEKKNLELAKTYFLKVLAMNPINDIAKIQLEAIEEKTQVTENQNIEDLLAFIEDQGLDFVMIFLAFLGGELIAKRYHQCQNSSIYLMINHLIKKKTQQKHSKMAVFIENYKHQKGFFCFLINLLVVITIAFALMVVALFLIFHYELDFFVYGDFLTMNAQEIEYTFLFVFMFTFLLTASVRITMQYKELPDEEVLYEITLVEELDRLVSSGEYATLYEVVQYLKNNGITVELLEEMLLNYSQESEYILKYYQKLS